MSAHHLPNYEAELEALAEKLKGHERPDDPSRAAYKGEFQALAEKLKGYESGDPAAPSSSTSERTAPPPGEPRAHSFSTSDPSPNSERRTPNSLWSKFTPIGGGRYHVTVEKGALAHTDSLRLASERQRLRFAQACDAKAPGCFAEVLKRLDREAVKQPFKSDPKTEDGYRLLLTPASKFLPEAVDWVWENYIPAASVTILEGDSGVGKSLLLCDLAARVSRGLPMPDRNNAFDVPGHDPSPEPGLVWWFSGHDHPEQTLSPRLAAAGADMNMIRIAEGIEDQKSSSFRPIAFPTDFRSLWKSRAHSPRLVILDPLSSFCGGAHNHQAAAKALSDLALFARETNAAVLVVRPRSHSPSDPTLSSCRSALLLAPDPSNPARKVLAPLKSNLCALAPSLELSIDHAAPASQSLPPPRGRVGWGGENDPATAASPTAPVITWHGPSPLTAADLARSQHSSQRSPFEVKKVEAWLSEKLSTGPRPAKEIRDQALLDDIPPILLRRAQISLNIILAGANGSTTWRLPEFPSPVAGKGLGVRGTNDQDAASSQRAVPPPPPRTQPPRVSREAQRSAAARAKRLGSAPIEPRTKTTPSAAQDRPPPVGPSMPRRRPRRKTTMPNHRRGRR